MKAGWVLGNLFVVLFFFFFARGGGSYWLGLSHVERQLPGALEVLLGEYKLVVLGWVAVRWLAIVTSFVVGISCGSVIVGLIEVIPPPPAHLLYCGMINAPKVPESWTSAHCLPPPPPSSVLALVSVCAYFLEASWLLLSSANKQRGEVAQCLLFIHNICWS